MTNERLTTAEAAELLGVHPVTLRKWRQKSDEVEVNTFEDCQGLYWYFQHERKVMYYGECVRKLKKLIERRKNK